MRGLCRGPEEAGRLKVRLLAALALLVFGASASAQTKPPLPISDLAGEWHGQWTSPSGYLFAGVSGNLGDWDGLVFLQR
jgi:hypothetical protein